MRKRLRVGIEKARTCFALNIKTRINGVFSGKRNITKAMKFAVNTWSSGGGARSGMLHLGSSPFPMETPSLLLSTRKGLPFFLSPDLLSSLPSPDSHLLHVCPLHFFEGLSTKTIAKIGGLNKMLGLSDYECVAVLRDSIHCLPDSNSSNKLGASFETPFGRFLVKPDDFIEMISSMRPNAWASLADEVPSSVSVKRNKTSVDRTVRWLDHCIALDPGYGAVFGSIVGGSSVEERQRCAQEIAKRSVAGYWIGGFGLGESIEDRPALLKTVIDCLPKEKPRLISGLGQPDEILQGVAAGVDLFDSTYIYHLNMGGFALIFSLESMELDLSGSRSSDNGGDWTKINLKDAIYRKDATPIIESCSCYTCLNHTKAYINHLLNVKELLAHILLEIHNTHHYLRFFRSIREAIKAGQFEQFRHKFLQKRLDLRTISEKH